MEFSYKNINSLRILSSGKKSKPFKDIIINKTNGEVIAFVLKSNECILPIDMLKWEKFYVEANLKAKIKASDILIKNKDFCLISNLYNMKVLTENYVYLGQLYDIYFDSVSNRIKSLRVKKKLLRLIPLEKYEISISDIVEIKDKVIVVKDPVKKKTVPLKNMIPAIE